MARECRADIVIGVGVGCGTCSLHPLESVLHSVIPKHVLVLAHLGVREWRDLNPFFIPVNASAAVLLSPRLVAATDSHASVQVPVREASVRRRKLLIAIEGSAKTRDDSANLISCPEPDVLSAGFLKQICMTGIEADAADVVS